ncbi:MAG: PTS sugar transporter subunit IIB [bacterium]|nr:MAG: PTS sugar transporter subunit IIB [bacterium]
MIDLLRIDDRLIHAQVVIGWGRVLHPDRIIAADDEVASDEWLRNQYLTATQHEFKVSILSLQDAVDQIAGGVFDSEKVILLVKGPKDVVRLMDLGLPVEEVNVGGLHYSEGKERILDFVYLNEADRTALRELVKRGVTLEARALPENDSVILNSRVV